MRARKTSFILMAGWAVAIASGAGGQTESEGRKTDQTRDPLAAFSCSPGPFHPEADSVKTDGQFNGYTNFWHDIFWRQYRYGNLFQVSLPRVDLSVAQSKMDIAEELGVPGLLLEEGFLDGLLSGPFEELREPTLASLGEAVGREPAHKLVFASALGEAGAALLSKYKAAFPSRAALKSRQFYASGFGLVRAFVLSAGPRRLSVVLSDSPAVQNRVRELVESVIDVVGRYDLHRGWFGTGTLLHSVTCFPGHPLEVIAQGLAQGNDWFTFSGYMDYLMAKDLPAWLAEVGLDVVTDVGTGRATRSLGTLGFGCRDWDGLKIQDTPTEKEWVEFVKSRGGYIFRPVFAPECDAYAYDGQIAVEGNKRQVDAEERPFILNTGFVREDAPPCMVLFAEKGTAWTREAMWRAILSRREVGILPQGKMLGPALFRNALQMLLLDRVHLERRFGDDLVVSARVVGSSVEVRIANRGKAAVAGSVTASAGPGLEILDRKKDLVLRPDYQGGIVLKFRPTQAAGGRFNPILVSFEGGGRTKKALAVIDYPPALSVHKLLYGQSPEVEFPAALANSADEPRNAEVRLRVFKAGPSNDRVYETSRKVFLPPGESRQTVFKIPLPPGSYEVLLTALGTEARSQLGVEAADGRARLEEVDLDGDGLKEYVLENSKVQATLLAVGARVIEYFVKERKDNVLFKLWPEKEVSTDRRPFRERGFYPYGGFEDFLGQASIETHKVYEAEVLRAEGPYVQVRMRADYYGNALEKTFTLYGDSPLLEVRFALDFRNPELNMLGPQPILELGKRHGTEDVFVVPGRDGLEEYRMRPEEYFGRVIFLREGWNAGHDPEVDVSFVGAFPVSEPEFLHMWMNHPSNGESNHYYAEFQPWVPIFQKTRRYFSYYLWAAPGGWRLGLEELRKRNLITAR
ncbi:MAG: hypothetical protein FJY80_08020 [Candidatus Aminicenantes bacterium]|nr:hypothetical protein [Candidatus Aminicenantes bacterium]